MLLGVGWWSCELDGWAGGMSGSARYVPSCTERVAAVDGLGLPKEMIGEVSLPMDGATMDEFGLPVVEDWKSYYELRSLPPSSPVALLLHFPLTLFYGIQRFAKVQLTVARMLNKRVAIHVVGVEKELNFLDMFDEVFALFVSSGVSLDLAFIVRPDMMPPKCGNVVIDKGEGNTIRVVAGSYNDSLSPDFDCGSGKPDIVFGMNAGLYAYDSWRHCVDYVLESGVLGIFTDYNEWSGLNCASLGGKVRMTIKQLAEIPIIICTKCSFQQPRRQSFLRYGYNILAK